jgi:hypothetical protein
VHNGCGQQMVTPFRPGLPYRPTRDGTCVHVRCVSLAEANRTGLHRNAPAPIRGQSRSARANAAAISKSATAGVWGDVMLDGKQYFASFPDEAQATPTHDDEDNKARRLTPGLIAALAELDRELRSFLDAADGETSTETSDDRRA